VAVASSLRATDDKGVSAVTPPPRTGATLAGSLPESASLPMESPLALILARTLASLVAALAAGSAPCLPARADTLRGAGATFPAPVYEAWADAYEQATGTSVRYDRVGSGFGVALISQSHVDFGASDAPLPAAQLAAAGLLQFPVVIGAVVPVVNIAGIARGQLHLDAATLSAIYRGKITNWRDPAIAALNPSLALPDANITVVHRADASGTTYLWSRWLSESDATWKQSLGTGTTLAWPTGTEGLGNEGVASLVQRTRAAIGYVAYAYARQHHLSDVALPSCNGAVVRATHASFEAAVAAARWRTAADLEQGLTNEPGANSWPIVGASFVLLPAAAASSRNAFAFFDWAMNAGGRIAGDLDYVALPDEAVKVVEQTVRARLP
jgi:phosphate transport system substrate-binding protein